MRSRCPTGFPGCSTPARGSLADGATGTNLFAMGLMSGDAPELWNVQHPRAYRRAAPRLHRGWRRHRADQQLRRHPLPPQAAPRRGPRPRAQCGRGAHRAHRGGCERARGRRRRQHRPTGEILEPLGPLSVDAARDAFAEQAAALAAGGADVLWIETMSSKEEVEAAIAGARATGLPVVEHAQLRHQRPDDDVADAERARRHPPHARAARLRQQLRRRSVGAGRLDRQPRHRLRALGGAGGEVELRPAAVRRWRDPLRRHAGADGHLRAPGLEDAGARIIGGCCGTTTGAPARCVPRSTARAGHRAPMPTRSRHASARFQTAPGAQLKGLLDRASGASPNAVARRSTGRRGAARPTDA